MDLCRWVITVDFDDPERVGRAREWRCDVDAGNGLSEAQAYVAWLREHWGWDGEEFDELAAEAIRVLGDRVMATSEVWDDYGEILRWLIGMTSPVRVMIDRMG